MARVYSVMGSNAGPSISSAQAGQVTVQRGNYELAATDSEDNTLEIVLVKLPAQHRLVELIVENDDLDSGASGTVDIGLLDTIQDPADTTNLTFFAAAQSVQAAAITRFVSQAAMELAAVNYDRYIVVNVDVASATGLAGGVAATLISRPELGAQFEN
jgi:hypothetical protein